MNCCQNTDVISSNDIFHLLKLFFLPTIIFFKAQ
jgi:hypothetical protein